MWFPLLSLAAHAQCADSTRVVVGPLIHEMRSALPERGPIDAHLVADREKNITITPERVGATLHVTFVHEGAGYRNRLGWFVFDPEALPVQGPIDDPQSYVIDSGVLFSNASLWNDGGDGTCFRPGDTADVLLDPAWEGLTLGFWLQANGAGNQPGAVWYSLDAMQGDAHALMIASVYDGDAILMGWEDIRRDAPGADDDFNDLILRLETTPAAIIRDLASENALPNPANDDDGDGVANQFDDFPDDPNLAIDNRYPPGSEYFTMAFEDLFPSIGDGDFNDFVAMGRYDEWLSPDGFIVRVAGEIIVVARGAGFDHTFNLAIDGLGTGSWTIDTYDTDEVLIDSRGGTGRFDLELIPSTRAALPIWNTEVTPISRGHRVEFAFVPDQPRDPVTTEQAPYDPYLYVHNTGYDIHLMGRSPIPGSNNPTDRGIGFVDTNGYPWALLLPLRWKHPKERTRIDDAYPQFRTWRSNNGNANRGWYGNPGAQTIAVPETFVLPLLEAP